MSGWRVRGVEENHPNTKNAPHRARFSCSVGMSREGGGGGTAGEEGVYVSRYINVITKKKQEPFVGMGTTAHPHPRRCRALVFRGRLTREGVGKRLGRGGRVLVS